MKTIEELLKNLARPEVLEFGLVTNRLPSVNIGGKFEPVDDEAPSTERLMQMLVTMGGSRYVDSLSDKPVQWTTRLDGVGVIAVAAIMRKDIVQARFTVAKREGGSSRSTATMPAVRPSDKGPTATPSSATHQAASPVSATQPAAAKNVQRSAAQPVPAPTPSPSPVGTKPQVSTRTQPSMGMPSSSSMPAVKPIQPQVIKNVGSSSNVAAGRPSSAPVPVVTAQPVPPPPEDEWDDDDEPTLQTLSPPVAPPGAKAARRPEEQDTGKESEKAVAEKAAVEAAEKAAAEKAADKVAADKAAAERAAAEKAAAEKAAAERAAAEKAAAEKAAAEKAAAEKAAAEKAAAEKAAAEKAAAEKAAAEKAAAEKAAAEKAAAEKAAAEKAAAEKAAAEKAAAEKAAAEKAAAEKAAAEKAAAEKAAAEKAAAEQRDRERAAQERATQELARIREQRAATERAAARDRAVVADAQRAKPAFRRISTPTSVDAVDVEITTNESGGTGVAAAAAAGAAAPKGIDLDLEDAGIESTVSQSGEKKAERERPRVDASAAIDAFLAMAVSARASDLHIISGRPVLLRVASDLLPRTQAVPPEQVERIAKDIIPIRLRETFDREGACDFAVEHPNYGRFRVNASRQRTGLKLNLRVIQRELPTLAALGLPESIASTVLRHQRGLVLVSGGTSTGKSSTLAALIDHLNRETARHVISVEEPIEHVHPRKKGLVSQREVGLHTRAKLRALQQITREDADVVVIGDLREPEAVKFALAAVDSGRLVLAATHAPSAIKTVERLLDMFEPTELPALRTSLAAALRLVISQRLVPSADRTRLHVAVELLPWSVALYSLIKEGKGHQIASLYPRARALGITRIDESLAELVRSQKVTLEVAKQYAESPSELEAHVARPQARK